MSKLLGESSCEVRGKNFAVDALLEIAKMLISLSNEKKQTLNQNYSKFVAT